MTTAQGRGRGRPSGSACEDTRERILAVAREHLAAKGFAGSSMRGIARDAGVDPSLISHYFGDKAGLVVATMELPVNPLERIETVFDGPLEDMGTRLIRTFLDSWDPHRDVFSALIRTTLGTGDPAATPILQVVRNVIVTRLSDRIGGDDAELRATLIASQLIGLASLRYVARLEPVVDASAETVARLYGPALQWLMLNRPSDGGSQSMEDESCGSTEEVRR
ncbi:TetR family transcriptional regulator [Aeromicrobium sp.]|uniref:TetR/AcrR family transcriptional regulator n=1 Tax=Aeromicrobium sp. TaxID=1871063 RepID=UPI0019CE1CEB|nr:TetR family transcriptional regulator [Aeromicrobium sp.]MBC7631061.1 TetR/AcrR family transcriptional regulator [Aeromicrobium sp.]